MPRCLAPSWAARSHPLFAPACEEDPGLAINIIHFYSSPYLARHTYDVRTIWYDRSGRIQTRCLANLFRCWRRVRKNEMFEPRSNDRHLSSISDRYSKDRRAGAFQSGWSDLFRSHLRAVSMTIFPCMLSDGNCGAPKTRLEIEEN